MCSLIFGCKSIQKNSPQCQDIVKHVREILIVAYSYASSMMVTGPSFVKVTSIIAPKIPVST